MYTKTASRVYVLMQRRQFWRKRDGVIHKVECIRYLYWHVKPLVFFFVFCFLLYLLCETIFSVNKVKSFAFLAILLEEVFNTKFECIN